MSRLIALDRGLGDANACSSFLIFFSRLLKKLQDILYRLADIRYFLQHCYLNLQG